MPNPALKSAIPELEELLQDEHGRGRALFLALDARDGGLISNEDLKSLVDLVLREERPVDPMVAMDLWTSGENVEFRGLYVRMLELGTAEERAHLIRNIGYSKRDDYIQIVLDHLKDENPEVRIAALQSLAAYQSFLPAGPGFNMPMLSLPMMPQPEGAHADEVLPLTRDEDGDVRAEAVNVLRSLNATRFHEELSGLLIDESGRVRMAVVSFLAGADAGKYVNEFSERLKDESGDVRVQALMGLSQANAFHLADQVLPLLRDPASAVRMEAASTLLNFDAHKFQPQVLELLKDGDKDIVCRVLDAVSMSGVPVPESAIQPLLFAREPEVRRAAIYAIPATDSKRAADQLVALLQDPQPDVVERALDVLARPDYVEYADRVIPFLEHKTADVRRAAVWAINGMQARDFLDALVPLARDPEADVRDAAMSTLSGMGGAKYSDVVAPSLDSPDPRAREQAIRSLGEMGDIARLAGLIPLVSDPELEVRRAVADSLANAEAIEYRTELAPLLSDPGDPVRESAVTAAGRLCAVELAEGVAACLDSRDTYLRDSAIDALGFIGREEDRDRLLPFLKDASATTRGRAVLALAEFRLPDTVEHLLPLLEDRSSTSGMGAPVHVNAIQSIGNTGSPEDGVHLAPYLRDRDPHVRGAAIEAIGHLRDTDRIPDLKKIVGDTTVWGMFGRNLSRTALENLAMLGDEESGRELIDDMKSGFTGLSDFTALMRLSGINNPKIIREVLRSIHELPPMTMTTVTTFMTRTRALDPLSELLDRVASLETPSLRMNVLGMLAELGPHVTDAAARKKMIEYVHELEKDMDADVGRTASITRVALGEKSTEEQKALIRELSERNDIAALSNLMLAMNQVHHAGACGRLTAPVLLKNDVRRLDDVEALAGEGGFSFLDAARLKTPMIQRKGSPETLQRIIGACQFRDFIAVPDGDRIELRRVKECADQWLETL